MEVYGTKLYIYKNHFASFIVRRKLFYFTFTPSLLVETECYSKQLSKLQQIHELPSWSKNSPNLNFEPVEILELVLRYTAKM